MIFKIRFLLLPFACSLLILAACSGAPLAAPTDLHPADDHPTEGGEVFKLRSAFPGQHIERGNNCYKMEINMPFIGVAEIDNELNVWSDGLIASTEREFSDLCAGGQRGLQLTVDYSAGQTNGDALGLAFFISSYTGGAHPIHEVLTMNFNLLSGRPLSYEDIFVNTNDLLEFFSDHARRTLRPKLGELWDQSDMFAEGLLPTPENFRHFTLNTRGLVLIFPHYQIAPYSEGLQTCQVLLEDLVKFQPRPGVWQ